MDRGNLLARLILMLWLPLGILVGTLMPRRRAFTYVFVGGLFFLPEAMVLAIPPFPPLNKGAIAVLAAYFGCWVFKQEPGESRRLPRAAMYLIVATVVSSIASTFGNQAALRYGSLVVPGLTVLNGVTAAFLGIVSAALPFFIGQALFPTVEALRELLLIFVRAVLFYLPLVLFEVRFSPQLHTWIYGFFQHDFIQMMRDGGFRAIVFMPHGLAVALSLTLALIATIGLKKGGAPPLPVRYPIALGALALALIGCKSLASMAYGLIAFFVLSRSPAVQLRFARYLSLAVMAYPVLRLSDLVPVDRILEWVRDANPDRSLSLEFRFFNEDMLLLRARERLILGWGGSGRSRVYDEWGRDLCVTDGSWIIALGTGGFVGLCLLLLPLLGPVFSASKVFKRVGDADARILSCTAVMLAFVGLDLIPNSMWNTLPYVLAGSLTSACAALKHAPAKHASSTRLSASMPLRQV